MLIFADVETIVQNLINKGGEAPVEMDRAITIYIAPIGLDRDH